ncbi:hypothetical protein ACHAP9_005059 [Verticillium nonalfalfae]
MPPSKALSARKQALTLTQLATYDDILTDAIVDHVFYWTTIPKNRSSYHASRGVREEEIAKIIQTDLVLNKDIDAAERNLLTTDGLRKFCNSLKTDKEKADFRGHLRRYLNLYLPDCPFEVNSTNRYTIVSHEAAITARRFIARNETVKYLSGVQVMITPEEEREMTARKKDFSIIISSRNKCASLFMGPARFANHDCKANAKLVTTGQAGIEIIATTNIDVGDEITVTYADSYFGEDNCECLCKLANTTNHAISAATTEPVTDPDPVVAKLEAAPSASVELPKKRKYQKRTFVKETTPPARHRIPGDYTLTPLLLSEPETAWIRCINCDTAFVQHNAYYTKSSCPRCERHSKLYGYLWPKTEKAGPRDMEERILDHRIIHRFLHADDEAKIRGRKRPASSATTPSDGSDCVLPPRKRQRVLKDTPTDSDEDCGPVRRSGRTRRVSSRLAEL